MEKKESSWWQWGIVVLVIAQIIWYSVGITDGFYDGRLHYNWGPPFWLLKAQTMHRVNFFSDGYLGVVSEVASTPAGGLKPTAWYLSHPQFIAMPLYVWTGIFGFDEWTVRSLSILFTLGATILLWLAVRTRHSARVATLVTTFWSLMSVIFIYGRKIDQEPFEMFFLALAFLAHEKYFIGAKKWWWVWMAAIGGMLWSDWSGWVFVVLFFVAQMVIARRHALTKKLLGGTILGAVGGTAIVLTQTMLEQKMSGGALDNFVSLYKYRSGQTENTSWIDWAGRQKTFFWTNFGLVGLGGLLWGAIAQIREFGRRKFRGLQENGLRLPHLFFLTALGTLFYALAVRQATSIHLYYQYFYAPLAAWGVYIFWEWWRIQGAQNNWPKYLGTVMLIVLLGGLGYWSTKMFNKMRVSNQGGPAEVALLKSIRNIPLEQKVAVATVPEFMAWLDNPNVLYYAGRKLEVTPTKSETAVSDYVLTLREEAVNVQQQLKEIVSDKVDFPIFFCSKALCLLKRVTK